MLHSFMNVIISVDVESPQTPWLYGKVSSNLMELNHNKQQLGVSRILRELNSRNLLGVFFVNVYESAMWGEEHIATLCRTIVDGGHELALHTHPAWMFDKTRPHMWQYSQQEQREIIGVGKGILERWVPGYKIISHRAGAYGVNEDTVTALRENGILVDSSMFYGHPNCKIVWSQNSIVKRDGLIEAPVTGFMRRTFVDVYNTTIYRGRGRFVKTDLNWSTLEELRDFIFQGIKLKIGFLNYFLHSYSLVNFSENYQTCDVNLKQVARFVGFLDMVKEHAEIENTLLKDLCYRKGSCIITGVDVVPVIGKRIRASDIICAKLKKFWGSPWRQML